MVMNIYKINIFFTILLFFGFNIFEIDLKDLENFTHGIRFKSTKCQSDNTTMITKYCYLRPVSRKVVTINVGCRLLIPYKRPFYFQVVIFYRYGTIFRQIIDTKKLEVCAILGGADTNPLVKLLIDMMKKKAPHLIHKCPYTGDFDMKNFTLNTDLLDPASMVFPQGIYRLDYFIYLNNAVTFNFSTVAEIKSQLKESYG